MVDLEAHKVSDLTEAIDFAARRIGMNERSSMGLAVKELLKPRIQILVGTGAATGKAIGVILRAHQHY